MPLSPMLTSPVPPQDTSANSKDAGTHEAALRNRRKLLMVGRA
jgi:hypothetical protein